MEKLLSFPAGSLVCKNISQLEPGQFFYLRTGGTFRLALSLAPDNGSAIWMNLSTAKAFTFEEARSSGGLTFSVLALPYAADQIHLRIDPDSAFVPDSEKHPLGELVIQSEGPVCIRGTWPDLDETLYRNVAVVGDWRHARLQDHAPRFAFKSWSLSFVDASGTWIDLVQRNGD